MSMTAIQASAYLHHLHFTSPDPHTLASFYAESMQMSIQPLDSDLLLLVGPGRRILLSAGEAKHLVTAGFAVRDAEALLGLRTFAEQHHLQPRPTRSPLFHGEAFAVTDPDGNILHFGLAQPAAPMPKGIRGPLQHLTLASSNIEAIEDFYANKLGFGITDRVVRDDGKLMTTFMRGNHEHHNLACFFQDRQGVDHHSYEAAEWDTIRDWADHLASKGITLMWGPGRHGPGNNLFLFIVDPDGNWIEISAELEVVQDRPLKTWPHAERTVNLWGRGILRA